MATRKEETADSYCGWENCKNEGKKEKIQVLYSTFKGNQATRYGISKEAVSIHQYVSHHQKQDPKIRVDKCGLFISESNNNWLAASPDGIVHDSSNTTNPLELVEIKNPFCFKDKYLMKHARIPP